MSECRRARDAKRDVPIPLPPRLQLVCAADVLRLQRRSTMRSDTAPSYNARRRVGCALHLASASFGGPFATPAIRMRLRLPRTIRLVLRTSMAGSE
jgi:hypothetical protein